MFQIKDFADKFNNFVNTHNYKIENFASSSQKIFDVVYLILGIDFQQEDIVVIQLSATPISLMSEHKIYADAIIFINNYLKKKSVKLLVQILPLFNKPENKKCYYERLIPVEKSIVSNYYKFIGLSNYITSNGVRLVYNTSLNESKDFTFIDFWHYAKKGLNILADEIIQNLENSDFFDVC